MGEGTGTAAFAALLALTGDTFLLVRDGRIVLVAGAPFMGYSVADVAGHHLAEFAHPDDLPLALEFIEQVRRGIPVAGLMRARAKAANGEWVLTELDVYDRADDSDLGGTVVRVRAAPDDAVDEPTVAAPGAALDLPSAQETAEATGALASLAEVVPSGILATDLRGFVVYANAVTRELLGGPTDQLSGEGWRDVVHPDDIEDVARVSVAALQGERCELMFRIVLPDDQRWILGRFAPLRPEGRITGLVATFDDATERRAFEAALAHQATHDELTGLPNRLLLRDRMSQALSRIGRTGAAVSVFFLDLDGFKAINDRHGHAAGDGVLVEVARRLLLAVRPTDTVARFGGDEFVVVCEGLDAAEAGALAERLQETVSGDVPLGHAPAVRVVASIGVAVLDRSTTVDEALHRADAAMYRAKHSANGRIEIATER